MVNDQRRGPGRARNTTRQREAGAASRAETRRRLVVAAAELFAERGYVATTVSGIAQRAGVSLQTLYLACGSKHELLQTVLGQALSGTSGGTDADYLPRLRAQVAAAADAVAGAATDGGTDAERLLRGFATVFRALAERAAPWWRTYRDAAAVDGEIAAEWTELSSRRRTTTARLLDGLTDGRPDVTADHMIDTVWTVASPETCDLLVRQAGYTFDAYEQWIADTLIAVLLPRST